MASVNKVILIGNLTADPELKQTPSGVSVTAFTLAVQRRFTNKENTQVQTADFINIVAWRQQAEFICRFFKKGRPICIVGAIQTRSWTANDGTKRYATEVVADEASFVDSKSEGASEPTQPQSAAYLPDAYKGAASFEEADDDDNVPF